MFFLNIITHSIIENVPFYVKMEFTVLIFLFVCLKEEERLAICCKNIKERKLSVVGALGYVHTRIVKGSSKSLVLNVIMW